MASGRKITVEFLGNNRDLNNAMDDSVRRSGRFSSALKKAGKVAAIGLAAGAAIAAKGLFEMAQAAAEDEKSVALLAGQLKNSTGATDAQIAAVEKMIDATSRATGVADDELRPAMSKLATATGDVEEAQDLLTLAMDVSAGSGKSLQSVTDALVKAQNGSVGGLGRLGIATKDAEGKTKSFAEIQDDMAAKFKGASATAAETMEGKMARLKVALSEAGEAIGYKLLPVAADLADWFVNKGLPAIEKFGGWIRDNLLPIFGRITDTVKKVFGGMDGEVGGNLGKVKETITSIVEAITALWRVFGDDLITYARAAFENVMQVISGVLDVIRGIVKVFASLFKGDWQGVWDGIKLIFSGAANILVGIVKQFLNIVKLLWKVAWAAIKALTSAAWEGIKTLVSKGIGKIVEWVRGIPGKFKNALSKLTETVRNVFDNAMTAGKNKVENIGATIVGWITGIPGKLSAPKIIESFKGAGKALIGAVVDGMKNAAGIISGIAGNVWDAVKSLLNGAIDKINAALEFTINLPGPDITVNPPNIPHMAKGGIVTKPTLALIGEDGPEAVVPLGRKNAPKGRLGVGGGGTTFNITIQAGVGDPVAIGRQLEKILTTYTGNGGVGRPLQVRTI